MIGYIYETTNLINKKKYRGSKQSDIFLNKEYYGSGKNIKRAVKKYGIDNFSVVLLEEVEGTYRDLLDREDYYIKDLFDTYPHELIYNISNGAFGGNTMLNKTKEEKAEIRAKHDKTKLEKYGTLAWGSSTLPEDEQHKITMKVAATKRKNGEYSNYSHDTSPYKAMKIDSIEVENKTEDVYCLSVEDTSSYIVEHAIVHNCESYLYYAFQYMGTQRDYNDPEQPETRAPKRNNTKLAGGLCKHLVSIIEHLQIGEFYEQMAKDVNNWKQYTLGNAYRSFNRGRNMGQYNKREKEIDWKKIDSFVDEALWARHNFAQFLRSNNIKKDMYAEINRLQQAGEDMTLDDFLEDEFGLTLQDLASEIGVEEKALDDYFKQTYGLTNTQGIGNLS